MFLPGDAQPVLLLIKVRVLQQPDLGGAEAVAVSHQKYRVVAFGPGAGDLEEFAELGLSQELDTGHGQGLGD
jgi:hypothetical protein